MDYPVIKLYATSVSDVPVNVTFSVPLMTYEFSDETLELQPGEVAVSNIRMSCTCLMRGIKTKVGYPRCIHILNPNL